MSSTFQKQQRGNDPCGNPALQTATRVDGLTAFSPQTIHIGCLRLSPDRLSRRFKIE
jgi:hypothetical protein